METFEDIQYYLAELNTEEWGESNLDVAVLGDDLEAVEVGAHLTHVIDHRGDTKYGGVSSVVLK